MNLKEECIQRLLLWHQGTQMYKIWHLDCSVRYHWLPDCYRIDFYWFQSATDFRFQHHLFLLKKHSHTHSFWSLSQHAPPEEVWLRNGFILLDINGTSWLTAKSCQIWFTGFLALETLPFTFLAWLHFYLKGYFYLYGSADCFPIGRLL